MIILIVCAFTITIIPFSITSASVDDLSTSQLIYGCTRVGQAIRCDPTTEKPNSVTVTGHVQRISTINLTELEPVEGVFGDATAIYGYRQQYLTISNRAAINPTIFSISFWIKQDPALLGNSSVISHVNSAKTAGWYVELYVKNSQGHIQFSVTNSKGKIFTVASHIDPGLFENVVGVFDGKFIKIYLNGFLLDSLRFSGDYEPDPGVPLNIALNSFNYGRPWNGALDEVRLYNRAISENDVQELVDYRAYSQSPASPSHDDGLIGYWPFEQGVLEDKSGNNNAGKMILPAVSMVFSPDGRLFFSVRDAGEIRIMDQDFIPVEDPFVKLLDASTNSTQEILGITLDPEFSTNHYMYAYVTTRDNNTGNNFNQIIRFTESQNRATEQKILVDGIPSALKGRLFGGALAFGPDEKLYVATGYTNQIERGQNANLTGKVLRINRDGTIPQDNPFPNSPVYTLGHRNMFGIAFDKETGTAIVAENGAGHHDEINLLERGGNYGYPAKPLQQSPPQAKLLQTDNSSAIKPARTYYKVITPTQMIFNDGNNFRNFRDMFFIASNVEGSLYALSINKTGDIVEEVAIRLPEVLGHIISIAKSPDGEIYLAGENMYKLLSIDNNRATLTYFVDIVGIDNNIQISGMSLDLSTKVLSIDISNSSANPDIKDNSGNTSTTSPSLQITVPKALLGTISEVTSENYNKSSNDADRTVVNFKTKETRRITNVGDTIIDIQINENVTKDIILIKGQTSTLVPSPSRSITIQR